MLHFIGEGEEVRYGLNFYRPSDKGSIGFKLKYYHNRVLMIRYSKLRKKIFVSHIKAMPLPPDWR